MKLINIQSQENLFEDPDFQESMSLFGIIIPEALQKNYNNKKRIYWKDPEFFRAFKELYFQFEMNPNLYEWR